MAIQLYDLEKGECLDTYTGLNGQRTYGADVIARIQAAVEGKRRRTHGKDTAGAVERHGAPGKSMRSPGRR